jgi:hypothetical protein
MISATLSVTFAATLLAAPPAPARPPPANSTALLSPREQRARRVFIAGGVMFGLAFAGEVAGATMSTTCKLGQPCALGLTFTWGSDSAGTRYTVFSTGTGSPYVISRVLAIPLIASGETLLLTGAHLQSQADERAGRAPPFSRRLAWGLAGAGMSVYVVSRLMRLGFAIGGVCQDPRCVYSFDQLTLGTSRALAFPGSAMLIYLRTRTDVRLGLAPVGTVGLGIAGEF